MRAIIDAGQIRRVARHPHSRRTAAEDLKDVDGGIIVAAGEMIQEWHIDASNAAGIQEVGRFRSS